MLQNTSRSYGWLLALALNGLLWTNAYADPFVVVVTAKANIQQLSHDELVEIFMDRSMGTGKNHVFFPIDQKDTQLKEDFYRVTAKLSLNSVHAYWSKRVFSGRGRPPPSMTDEEIRESLLNQPEAIAYMRQSQVPANAKVVFKSE